MDFEELIWLFTSDKKSRGIVRLNIAEGALLYKYSKKVCDGILLEIGRKHGGSTALMVSSLDKGHLYSLDIVMHDSVYKNTKQFENKITFITTDSKFVDWNTKVDLVFIDGDHSYKGVKSDIKKFTPYVNSNGYVIFHDVVGKKSILNPLIDRLIEKGWSKVDQADSMLVLQNVKD